MSSVLFILDPVVPLTDYQTCGSTNAAISLAKSMADHGVSITIAGQIDGDIGTVDTRMSFVNTYEGAHLYMKDAFRLINNHLDTTEYDYIWVHISTPSVAKYLNTINSKNAKVYFTLHSWSGTAAVSYYQKDDYLKLIDDEKVTLIFLCKSQMEQFFSQFDREPKNYYVISNAVDESLIRLIRRRPDSFRHIDLMGIGLPNKFIEEGYHLAVCRLVKSKHPYDIVEAASLGHHNLVLVGDKWINDQEYADQVIDKIRQDNGQSLYLIEKASNINVLALMKYAKSTVLYTDIEVNNLTVMESCSIGTPVVVGPRGSGVTDTIEALSPGGIEVIEFPKRSTYQKKLQIISDLMSRAETYRYDCRKFPKEYLDSTRNELCLKLVGGNS